MSAPSLQGRQREEDQEAEGQEHQDYGNHEGNAEANVVLPPRSPATLPFANEDDESSGLAASPFVAAAAAARDLGASSGGFGGSSAYSSPAASRPGSGVGSGPSAAATLSSNPNSLTPVLVIETRSGELYLALTEPSRGASCAVLVSVGPRDGVLRSVGSFQSVNECVQFVASFGSMDGGNSAVISTSGAPTSSTASAATTSLPSSLPSSTGAGGTMLIARVTPAQAVLGAVVAGGVFSILLATQTRCDLTLPGKHRVETVAEAKWLSIPLQHVDSPVDCGSSVTHVATAAGTSGSGRRGVTQRTPVRAATPGATAQADIISLNALKQFVVDNLHFFCLTADVTRPFPSSRSVLDYDPEFCWNEWLASPFASAGLRQYCVVLLQGMARGGQAEPEKFISLFTRKSNVHPGTRYHARGLNSLGGVGNEIECELLMWQSVSDSVEPMEKVEWVSHVWRRGTVPIWWKSTMQSTIARETGVEIRDNPFEGAECYYSSVVKRYESCMAGEGLGTSNSQGQSKNFTISLCSLLRCNPTTPAETQLAVAFQESLRYVDKHLPSVKIKMVNFDWHHNLKQLGSDPAISGLWGIVATDMRQFGVSHGTLLIKPNSILENSASSSSLPLCPDGRTMQSRVARKQEGVMRYNCADSLDRTNVATFFMSFQVVIEMLHHLKRTFTASSAPEPWVSLTSVTGIASAGKILARAGVLDYLVDFFVQNGDVCSLLYTNSPAMHTGPMREFASQKELQSAPMNALIAIRRRYHNLLTDPVRHAQYAMFLGRKLYRHFPHTIDPQHTALGYSVRCLTDGPRACLLKRIPNVLLNTDSPMSVDQTSSLLFDRGGHIWCVPADSSDVVNVYVHLDEPAVLTELVLTIAHGGVSHDVLSTPGSNNSVFQPMLKDPRNPVFFHTSPVSFDCFSGMTLDDLHPVCTGINIPYAANGTQLVYDLSTSFPADATTATASGSSVQSASQVPMPGSAVATELGAVYDFYADRDVYSTGVTTAAGPGQFVPDKSIVSIVHLVFHKRALFTELGELGMTIGNISVFGQVPNSLSHTVVPTPSATNAALERLEDLDTSAAVQRALEKIDSNDEEDSAPRAATSRIRRSDSLLAAEMSLRIADQSDLEQYVENVLEFLKDAVPDSDAGPALSFRTALKLEHLRVRLRVSPQQRDDALSRVTEAYRFATPSLATFNPSNHIRLQDPVRLAADYEAREEQKPSSNVCSAPGCTESLESGWLSKVFGKNHAPTRADALHGDGATEISLATKKGGSRCSYCFRRFCSHHMFSNPVRIVEYGWIDPVTQRARVCTNCAVSLESSDQMINGINSMIASRRHSRSSIGSQRTPTLGNSLVPVALDQVQRTITLDNWRNCFPRNAPVSLARAPQSRLLFSVPSQGDDAASLLLDPNSVPTMISNATAASKPWAALDDVKEATFSIVLVGQSRVRYMDVDFACPCMRNQASGEVRCGADLTSMSEVPITSVTSTNSTSGLRFTIEPSRCLVISVTVKSRASAVDHTADCEVSSSLSARCFLALRSIRVMGDLIPVHICREGWHFLGATLQKATPVERITYEKSTGRAGTALSARTVALLTSSGAGGSGSISSPLPPHMGGGLWSDGSLSTSASPTSDGNVVQRTNSASSSPSQSSSASRSSFENAIDQGISGAAEGMKVALLRPQWAHYRPNTGRRVLDVGVDASSPISGFSMLVRHSEKHGKGSQVKAVRVSAVTTDARGRPVAARTLCTRVVPLVRPGTELLFDFARTRGAHVFVFEFLTCYGAHYGGATGDISPPRVALFVRPG